MRWTRRRCHLAEIHILQKVRVSLWSSHLDELLTIVLQVTSGAVILTMSQ